MNYDLLSLLLLLITLFLVLKNNKLYIVTLLFTIIFFILNKKLENFPSSLDIYYPSTTHDNKENTLNVFKNISNEPFLSVPKRLSNSISNNTIYNTDTMAESENNENKLNDLFQYLDDNQYYYILLYKENNQTLCGDIFDINNSTVFLNDNNINFESFSNTNNFVWNINKNNITSDIQSCYLELIPNNTKLNKPIKGYLEGYNNGNVAINPIKGDTNSIFYFEDFKESSESSENISTTSANIENIYETNILCINGLYLESSDFEKNQFNNTKVVLKKNPKYANGSWYILVCNNTPKDLYTAF